MKKHILFVFASAMSFAAMAAIDGATKACNPGTWTTSIENARKVGKANNRFIAIAWGKSEGCGFCNSAASNVFNKDEFKQWSKDNGIPILWADHLDGNSCGQWIWEKYYGSKAVNLPQFLVIDPSNSDKLVLKALFQGSTVQYGTESKTSSKVTGCPNGWLMSPFDPAQTVGMVDWVLSCLNNTASSAVEVVPDAKGAATLAVNRLWNTYGIRSLSCTNRWSSSSVIPKIALITHAEDQFDWFKFDVKASGAYEVKLQDYVDSHNEGKLYVFQDAATAKAVTTYADAAAKAMASCPMPTIDEQGGWKFAVPAAGTYYLLFTRPDSEKCKQLSTKGVEYDGYVEKTLTYNFTLQETDGVDSCDYWFDGWLALSGAEGTTNELIVTRSESKNKGSVNIVLCNKDEMTDIPLAKPGDYIAAIKGDPGVGDFYLIDDAGNVLSEVASNKYACSFAADAATSKIRFVFNRGPEGIQRRDRAFGVRLDVKTEETDSHYHETFATIEDADKSVNETEGALNTTETAQSNEHDKFGLIGDQTSHVYFFTNVAHTAGSVYGFFVQAGGANDFANGRLKVEVIRTSTGERLVPVASNDYDAATWTLAANNTGAYATYIYGTDSANGFGSDNITTDVVIKVSRASAEAGEFPDVRYWLQWQRFERPVVSFADSSVSYTTEERPDSVTAAVAVDSLAAIQGFHAPFALDVAWKTAAPSSGSAATAGVDYEAVSDGLEVFATDPGTLTANLLKQTTLSYPTRSFSLQLQADPNKLYVVGDKTAYTVTLKEDEVKANDPVKIDVSSTGWQSTGDTVRNLSYTNVVDWITVTNVQASTYEYEYTTNYVTTVVTNVQDYRIERCEDVTNFTARVDVCLTNFHRIVNFDGVISSNIIDKVSGWTDFVTNILSEVVDESKWAEKALELSRELWKTNTIVVPDETPSAERVAQRFYYRLKADDVFDRPVGEATNVLVEVYTNGAPAEYSYRLDELLLDDESQAPVMHFDKLDDETVQLRVCRPSNDTVRVEYKLSVRAWEKPLIRFVSASASTNDTCDAFDISIVREGNTTDEIVVGLSASNETSAAECGYFSIPDSVKFDAGSALAAIRVTVTNPLWNKINWTGDRAFAVRLHEIAGVGAFDFCSPSNTVVTLTDTNAGLDDADDYDDTREGAFSAPISIVKEGVVTNLVRTLNGTTIAAYGVNDANDWFRFTGIETNETYLFSIEEFETNVEVRASLYLGEATDAFDDVSLQKLVTDYRYDATTNADVTICIYRAQTAKLASVRYTFCASHYIWPVVGFTTGEIVVTNTVTNAQMRTESTVVLEAYRLFNTNRIVAADVSSVCMARDSDWGNTEYLAGVVSESLLFQPAEAVTNEVTLGINTLQGAWVGDWTFNVALNVNTNWVKYGEITNVVVRVVDKKVPEKDPTDGPDGDDFREGAAELDLSAGVVLATNHLNGIDVEHEGVLSTDTNDWFKLTGLVAENTYRLSIPDPGFVVNNAEDLGFSVTIESETFTNTVTAASLAKGGYLDIPSPSGDDVYVKVARTTCGEEKPVSVAYLLKVEKIDWPKFDIAAEKATVRNDAGVAKAIVTRSDNTDAEDTVVVRVADENDVKVVADAAFETNITFAAGEVSKTVAIGLVPSEMGYWKRGGDFTFVLEQDDKHPYVTLGETNAVVTVTDASGIPENDYSMDDDEDGAQEYALDVVEKTATNHLAKGQSVAWLNGDDVVDWYRLTGAKAGNRYRISITAFGSVNVEKSPATIMIAPEGMSRTAEVIGKNGIWSWDYEPQTDCDLMVKISRTPDATKDVSVKYLLTFRQLASAYVKFLKTEETVSGAASVVYADVECAVDAGEVLFEDAVVKVWPLENENTNNAARAGIGFDARPLTLTWEEGSTGGVQRIAVPIGGSSGTWKGDETFLLCLSNETDSVEVAAPENGGVMCVTVTDIATPVYGTVGITKVGTETETLLSASTVNQLNVREGDSIFLQVDRTGGQAGWVDGVWKWMDGKTQVGETVKARLFDGVTAQEATTAEIELMVPTVSGYKATRTLTLNFSIETAKAKTVTVTKGTPTALKFAVADKDYAAALSVYSADDPAKVAFRTSGSAWFLDAAGGVRAALAANATQTMTATVTGPGTLTFDAEVAGGCALTVKVNGSVVKTLNVTAEDESVRIEANGSATVSFVCASPKTLATDSACAVSDIRFERDDLANKYGTFTGRALVNGLPGAATLTVSTKGKISGKIACPDRTWTFSATGGWGDDGSFTVALKSCKITLEDITFQLRLATGEVLAYDASGLEPMALLARNVWNDKPLSAEAAWAYKNCTGYLTAVLPPETEMGDPLYGSGYCGLTVSKSGSVKAVGKLADGQTLSVSATLLPVDGASAKTFLFAKPSTYNGGWYFASPVFTLRDFGADGEKVVVTNGVLESVLNEAKPWTSSATDAKFEREPDFVGGWYDKTENLYDHYTVGLKVSAVDSVSDLTIGGKAWSASAWATDEKHPISLSFNEAGSRLLATCGGDSRLFSVSLTRSTGLFSGYFRAVYDYERGGAARTMTKSFVYRGMLIPYAPESEVAAGRGYFLMPETNPETGKTGNKSYDVEIGE